MLSPKTGGSLSHAPRVARRTGATPLLVETLAKRSPKRDRKLFHYFGATKCNTKIIM